MEEFPRKGRRPSYDEEDFDGISRLLGMNAEEDESDNDSSNFWKEKLDHTIYALESCEKNKQLIEKQNELLRRENDEHRLQSEEFKARLTMLNEKYKVIEEDRDKLKGSNLQISERFTQLEHDLSVEKEKTKRFEIKLGENETIKNELMKENCSLKEVYEKIIAKTKALEEFANELISVKEILESKLEVCHDKMSDKVKEVRLLENTIQVQAGEIDKLENTVGEVSVEVENLKDAFEKCQQKNLEAGESIIDLRETFTAQNKKLSDECYSQAVRLEKSYSDCDLFCKRIEELETTLVGAQKDCDREAEILQETLNFTEEELNKVKDEKMVIKEEVKELEIQVSSYREEIKNLRELLAEERSARLEVEGFRDKWETDCKDHSREIEELKSSTQELKAELLVQKQSNEMTEEGLREMRREKMGLMDEVEKMRQQRERELDEAAVLNAKLDELVEENYKLKEEIAQLRDDNAKLAGENEQAKAENQWLGSMNEDSKGEASVLRSNLEKLKNHVWRLQQSAINAAAEEESKEKLKEHCSDLEEEKRGLIKMVDDLKLERSRLEKINEGVNVSIWKMKQEQLVLQSKCKELEKMVEERQHERKSILWKGI